MEKVGETTRTPLGALKRICSNDSIEKIIAVELEKFERILDETMKQYDTVNIDEHKKSIFEEATLRKYGYDKNNSEQKIVSAKEITTMVLDDRE